MLWWAFSFLDRRKDTFAQTWRVVLLIFPPRDKRACDVSELTNDCKTYMIVICSVKMENVYAPAVCREFYSTRLLPANDNPLK